ncbi:alpha/beta fold hydrolase [Streptomyces rugosispiralis]|uniref:Alpha/beta hydrolase n=1 Tax=Streptomyces rugosispiralis TaxID=2967341 RepID=A0ABT1VB71_9ACTN|nr:alpha/beta hydrolase [Streptomyces rugosispiralis]MCQ8193756.1 alpha/beta hydrolase [Streptomyces rugosispiralis]
MRHRTLHANGINIHIAEAGEGPLVILLHGFPELWYSWRHQLGALAAAGFHVIAPDLRGYGQTTVLPDVKAYGMQAMVDDVVGMLDALDEPTAALVGHDWGAQIGWACAQLAPERFPALAALSVPYHRRPPAPMTQALRRWADGKFNWLLHFQAPGVAEAELQTDVERSMRLIFSALSGDAPDGLAIRLLTGLPAGSRLLDPIPEPARLPSWLAESDLSYYAEEFRRTGFTGALNRYRNVDRDWEELPALGATPIRRPVLFVTGELDTATRFMDTDAMRQYVPNLRGPVVLPGCGHWIQQERPSEVNALLVDFLSSATVQSAVQ